MREIKFRAWDKLTKQMYFVNNLYWCYKNHKIDGLNIINEKEDTLLDDEESLNNIILMQYTGLKDKNGVEIYEGDILYYCPFISNINNRVVELKDGAYQGRLLRNGCAKTLKCLDLENTEVIGNIYENKDLLEERNIE